MLTTLLLTAVLGQQPPSAADLLRQQYLQQLPTPNPNDGMNGGHDYNNFDNQYRRPVQPRTAVPLTKAQQRKVLARAKEVARVKAETAKRVRERRLAAGIIDPPLAHTPSQLRAALVYGQVVSSCVDNGIPVPAEADDALLDYLRSHGEPGRKPVAIVPGQRGIVLEAIYGADKAAPPTRYRVLELDGENKGHTCIAPISGLLLAPKFPADQAVLDAFDSKEEMKKLRENRENGIDKSGEK
jgi:hypothetical protein